MNIRTDVERAARRIQPHIRPTPMERSEMLGEQVWLKCENFQATGSFKLRGAANALLCLSEEQRARGVVTASSGNHGLGLALAATKLKIPATVFVPLNADDAKVAAIQRLGVSVERVGDDCVDTEAYARLIAAHHDRTYISPYNDPNIIAGQGTVGLEMAKQVPDLDAVFVAIGGGGLIAGVGGYLKALSPNIEIIGCSPAASPAMHMCMRAGDIVKVNCRETLSDATAGGVEPGAITLQRCIDVVDRSILVGEAEIGRAIKDVIHTHHMLIEGAAGVAVAGYRSVTDDYAAKRVAIILCGANIGEASLLRVLRS